MDIDYHALLPEIILSSTILLVLVVDVFLPERAKWFAMPLGLVGRGRVARRGALAGRRRRPARASAAPT